MPFTYVPVSGSWPGQTGSVSVTPVVPMVNGGVTYNARRVFNLVNGAVSFNLAATDSIGNDIQGAYRFDINVTGPGNSESFSTTIPSSYASSGLSINTQLPLNQYPNTSSPVIYAQVQTLTITTSQTVTVPSWATKAVLELLGGGGGGGGGGSALTTGGVATQVGGSGGGQGQSVQYVVSVTPGDTLTVTIGAGGAGGLGGAVNGNAGTAGGDAGTTSIASVAGLVLATGTVASVQAIGGNSGAGGGANSTANVSAGTYAGTSAGNRWAINPSGIQGWGGGANNNAGYQGGAPEGPIQIPGFNGGGGTPANATLGGLAGSLNGKYISGFYAGSANGGSSPPQGANTGLGGAGGGGGAPGGTGGSGGNGGSGLVCIEFRNA